MNKSDCFCTTATFPGKTVRRFSANSVIFFVILHKNESQFSTPVKKVPDDIF